MIQKEGPDTIAAFFGEPVMGAGGVVVPPVTYWEKIQAVLKKYDILLVADEVICGFGRTGKMFGCETLRHQAGRDGGLQADHLELFSAFSDPDERAHVRADRRREQQDRRARPRLTPRAAIRSALRVALENLKIIEERGLVAHAAELGGYMQGRLRELTSHPLVGEVRGVGLIAAIELVLDKSRKTAAATPGAVGGMASRMLQERGVIVAQHARCRRHLSAADRHQGLRSTN